MGGLAVNLAPAVKEKVKGINEQIKSRAVRASNELRNAELEVLRGNRGGKTYRKPHTKHATYVASAPGEPPASRTGKLRRSFRRTAAGSMGSTAVASIETDTSYAGYLEGGTGKMAARPYVEATINKALPSVQAIYAEPFQ